MSKDIIVQIKVKEAIDNQMAYIIPDYPWILIPKSTCTVIETVERVQELEQQIKDLQAKLNTYEIEESITMKYVQPEPFIIAKSGEWVKIVDMGSATLSKIKPEFTIGKPYELNEDLFINGHFEVKKDDDEEQNGFSVEISRTMKFEKCSAHEPQRKSLGMHEGAEVFDNTDAWFVDLKELEIVKFDHIKHSIEVAGLEGDLYDYSKLYLTPKEANARLKEIVREKANDYPVLITVKQLFSNNKQFILYAIEAFEKDHNITYLPE